MIELKVTGTTIDEIRAALDSVARRDAPTVTDIVSVIKDLSLDQLREFLVKRFEDAGFAVTITEKTEPEPEKAKPTKPVSKARADNAPKATAELNKETATAALNDTSRTPESDRQYVIDTLTKMWGDKEQLPAVKTFADKWSKQYKVGKISEIAADVFPKIRSAMEKEFSLGT